MVYNVKSMKKLSSQCSQLEKKIISGNEEKFMGCDVLSDGNCLFRAVSFFLYGHQDAHHVLRKETITYIRKNWLKVKDYIFVDNDSLKNVDSYCDYMSKSGVYGTSVEILALSEIKKIKFLIYAIQNC